MQNDENGTIVASSTVALLQRVVTNSDPFLFDSNLDVLSLICVVQRDGSGCPFWKCEEENLEVLADPKNKEKKDDGKKDTVEVEQNQEKGKKNTQTGLSITALEGIGNQIIVLLKFPILICVCNVMWNVYAVMRM